MLYSVERGPQEQALLATCLRERRDLPDSIKNAPQLVYGLELYYTAYLDLQSCRATGWTDGRISWLNVNEYAMRCEYSEEQHDDLQFYVARLDDAYLTWKQEKRKRETAAKAAAK